MTFIKGYKQSEEHRRKNGEAHKGCTPWNKGLKTGYNLAHALALKGKKASAETREKMRVAATGRKLTDEEKRKVSLSKIGRKIKKLCGENHWNWKGGITSENRRARNTFEWRAWRTAVFARDK